MKKFIALALTLVMALSLVACGNSNSDNSGDNAADNNGGDTAAITGTVSTDGSTSMEKVIGALSESFMAANGGVTVNYNPTGSGSGITAVQEGTCDIGLSSRALKDEEKSAGLKETVLAYDGIAIIVHPDNPVSDLSVEQIAKLYTGEITNWSELGGADHAIRVLYRDDQSGSQRLFEKMVFKGEDVPDYEALGFERLDEMNTLVSACLDDPYAIGYSIMTYLNDVYSNEALLAFSLNGYSATPENVRTGDYPLGTKGYVVIRSDEPEDSPARRLYNWFGSPLSDTFLTSCGITPLSE